MSQGRGVVEFDSELEEKAVCSLNLSVRDALLENETNTGNKLAEIGVILSGKDASENRRTKAEKVHEKLPGPTEFTFLAGFLGASSKEPGR